MKKHILFALLIGSCALVNAQVVINEYSCSNFNGPTDNFGQEEDWAELYNPTGAPVDLTGFYLSDKAGNLTKWQIPAISVPANGYTMVYFSKRGVIQGGEIHPDFTLTQSKAEWIILTNAVGNVSDSVHISRTTKEDHSMGRETNGAANWKLFLYPTPNAANAGGIDYYTPRPILSIAPGFYTTAQTVSMTCPMPSTTIRYTLDGSAVTATSALYTAPINITATTVVRAGAFSTTNEPSFMETNTYFINVNHTLPVISICGSLVYTLIANGSGTSQNRVGHFELFEQDKSFIDEGQGHFNKHGNDSWAYDQRGFDFIMRDEMGYNNEVHHKIFPEKSREDFQRLIIKAAANDNYPFVSTPGPNGGAHIRDAFVHTLSIRADVKLDERTWRPAILYLNGQYWGVYDIREKVDDGDYTEYYYQQNKFNLQYLKTWGGTWEEFGAPNAAPDWNALTTYVAANNMGIAANFNYVDSLLNWHSLVDYFVFNSYIVSKDWLNWNTAWWRGMNPNADKKKWRYTLWDMDASFGHYTNYTNIPDASANADPCNVENLPNPGGQGHTPVLQKLINENPLVEQYYITRYIDLVNTSFSCPSMQQLLDSMINEIQPEMQGQIDRWGGTYAGWQLKVQDLKDFIDLRCTALTQGLIDCYDLSGPFLTTFDVTPNGAGNIKVNSAWAPTDPWSASYFGGIVTLLDQNANAGFVFDHWESDTDPLDSLADNDQNSVTVSAPGTITAVFKAVSTPVPPSPPAPANNLKGVQFPTAFSPNSDKQNNTFALHVGGDVRSFTFRIYDRWGNQMVSTQDAKFVWDGTYKGKAVQSGVYVYQLEVEFKNGEREQTNGNITIVQ